VADLDRAEIRRSVLERFSVGRMTDGYEAVYRRVLAGDSAGPVGIDGEPGIPVHAMTDPMSSPPIASRRGGPIDSAPRLAVVAEVVNAGLSRRR
jgi:hypothetical protein